MKKILKEKTLSQYLKFLGYSWNTLDSLKIISNRTYYRLIKGENKPQNKTIEKFTNFLEIDKKTFLTLLENEIKARKKL